MIEVALRHPYASGFAVEAAFVLKDRVSALFGPSGSGKTTILENIAGIRHPQSGRIVFDGQTLLDTAQNVVILPERREIGVLFQDHLLFPHLSVQANLHYGAKRARRNGTEKGFDRVVRVLDLRELLTRYPRQLSGGERQRVALGRALLCNPKMLLLDEPLTALDEPLKERILKYLDRVLSEWDLQAIFVSHGQAEVRRLAERVVVLDAGRVVAEGPPEQALAAPGPMAFKNASAPMNLLRLEGVAQSDGQWRGAIGTQTLLLPPAASPYTPSVYLQFPPDTVVLSTHEIDQISARNHLHGVVRQVLEFDHGCFVAIDAGQILWSEVTRAAIRDLAICPGKEVVCLIKTHSLRVIE